MVKYVSVCCWLPGWSGECYPFCCAWEVAEESYLVIVDGTCESVAYVSKEPD